MICSCHGSTQLILCSLIGYPDVFDKNDEMKQD